ncbi:rCG44731, isoform CRA_a [Rattus norvegicus]|uniref:RCG44731, isoform CRA_a n=1 Tax=Rattus norvegicus TaxID=10116 RepID=A6I530_RAT|nr:rCG44731, isoform CRA_a [Rattus norvegicus]
MREQRRPRKNPDWKKTRRRGCAGNQTNRVACGRGTRGMPFPKNYTHCLQGGGHSAIYGGPVTSQEHPPGSSFHSNKQDDDMGEQGTC